MHSNEGDSVSTYPRRPKAEAFDNAVDVVELLLAPTDQALNVRHLRVLHTFSSVTSTTRKRPTTGAPVFPTNGALQVCH